MDPTTRTVLKTALATTLFVAVTGSVGAMAGSPWTLVGSGDLAPLFSGSSQVAYDRSGAKAAETALLGTVPTQRIAPMVRNFKTSVLSAHPNWTPGQQNIIGLDAAVIVEKSAASGYSKCPNLAAALDSTAPGKAQVDTLLGLVLGGKGGAGTSSACRHPDRLAAVDALAGCFGGISFIDHVYRRDDRSGATSTMRERFRVQYFCNGGAPGLLAGVDSNLANADGDPIRRTCVPEAPDTYAKTACTLYPAATPCTAGDASCTQGLVVALSENDPGMPDINASIARRVRLDANNQTVGFAGRAASRQTGNAAPNINGISPNNFNVRAGAYFVVRRLFLNLSDRLIGTGRAGGRTADDIANDQAQLDLYASMTDPVLGGRFNLDPLLVANGFIPCTDDYSDPVGPSNLCSSEIPPPPGDDPRVCIAAGGVGDNGASLCCPSGQPSPAPSGVCPGPSCVAMNEWCTGSGQGTCCAGLTCTDQGTGDFACN
jgi:hypothetical protein